MLRAVRAEPDVPARRVDRRGPSRDARTAARERAARGRPAGRARRTRQGTGIPARRSAPQSQISGRPVSPVGSATRYWSKSAMPSDSALKPPAQSSGGVGRDVALDLARRQGAEPARGCRSTMCLAAAVGSVEHEDGRQELDLAARGLQQLLDAAFDGAGLAESLRAAHRDLVRADDDRAGMACGDGFSLQPGEPRGQRARRFACERCSSTCGATHSNGTRSRASSARRYREVEARRRRGRGTALMRGAPRSGP